VFINANWGYVERVDLVPVGRIPKGRFKTAFIHYRANSWNTRDTQACEVLEKLSNGPTHHVEITYDEPWYWKIFISSAERTAEAPKPEARPALKFSITEGLSDPSIGLTVDVDPSIGLERPSSPLDDMLLRKKHENQDLDAVAYDR